MMVETTESLRRKAEDLISIGELDQARQLIKQLLLNNSTDEAAWQLFIDTLPTAKEKMIALDGMLKIFPYSQKAHLALESLKTSSLKVKDQANSTFPDQAEAAEFSNSDPLAEKQDTLKALDEGDKVELRSIPSPAVLKKRHNKPQTLIVAGICVVLLVVIFGLFFYWRGGKLSIGGINDCPCSEAEGYMARLQSRVEEWKTYQTLSLLAASQGDILQDIDFAQRLYDAELNEDVPQCLLKPHEVFLSLLDYHVKYASSLQARDYSMASLFHEFEKDKQLELRDAVYQAGLEYRCQP